MKLKFEVARTGKGWEQLQELMEKYSNERWLPYTNPPRTLERSRAAWERSLSYDPATAFERVTCPAFIYWGSLDSNMPAQASIPIIEQALIRAGNEDFTINVFPRGRHDLIEGVDGGPKESARMKRYVPGYWNTVLDWLLKRVNTKARV